MNINGPTLGLCGGILVALGLLVSAAGLALFLSVAGGISIGPYTKKNTLQGVRETGPNGQEILVFHHSDYILPSRSDKALLLLPLAAGVLLTASGIFIRAKIPAYLELERTFPAVPADVHDRETRE